MSGLLHYPYEAPQGERIIKFIIYLFKTDNDLADVATRSMIAAVLANSETWWQGPNLLREAESEWQGNLIKQPSSVSREIRIQGRFSKAKIQGSQESTLIVVTEEGSLGWPLYPFPFSSWTRLAGIHGLISHFLHNCCLPKAQRRAGEIRLEGIKAAEAEIIAQVQEKHQRVSVNRRRERTSPVK